MPPARDSLAVSSPSGQIPTGTTIGARFRIEAPLYQDAVSQTYRATDLGQGTPAAVRVVPLRLLGAQGAQLESDIEKASAVVHKNLVEVLMVGREADFYYIATELLDGQTLRDFIDGKRGEGRGVSFRGACNLITHITNALEKAATFMPHGGLNPASVWVNKAGRVKVADLGLPRTLAPLARRGAPQGAPDTIYVAPEIVAGGPPSAAGDVYALGVILYEVLTGRPPSAPLRPASQLAADAPPGVDGLIQRATQRAPEARFGSPAELRQALLSVGTQVGAGPIAAAAPAGVRTATPLVAPSAIAAGADGRLTLGKSFNVAEAAGGAADDSQERWLIQKDKLDFGPFSLAQIRAQIERGEIVGEHMIVDSDTGARKKVKDYPALKEFTKNSERRLEQMRRSKAEHSHEQSEKKKSMATFLIVGVALAAVVGGIALYVLSRKAAEGGTLASRQEEAEVDSFIKEVRLNFATAHVAKRGTHRGGGGGGGDAEFNNDMNLGDVTKGGGGGGDETLDDGVIQKVMMGNYRSLVPCIMQEKHHNAGLSDVSIDFVVRGSGKVSAVKVNGQRGGAFPSCVLGRMQSFNFPHFNGSKTVASWSMSMR
jgi:hypothetical protein